VKWHSDTRWSSKAAAVNSISRQHEKSWLLHLNTCVILQPKRSVHARMQLYVSVALKITAFFWSEVLSSTDRIQKCLLSSSTKRSPWSWALLEKPPAVRLESNLIFLRPISILSTHLRLGLPSGLFPWGFLTNILYVVLLALIRVTCPAQPLLLDLIILIILGEEYRLWISSLCSL
jgi:hypothetical protein